jgi:hypothetical protein
MPAERGVAGVCRRARRPRRTSPQTARMYDNMLRLRSILLAVAVMLALTAIAVPTVFASDSLPKHPLNSTVHHKKHRHHEKHKRRARKHRAVTPTPPSALPPAAKTETPPPTTHPIPVDGPICPGESISLPCQCPEAEPSNASPVTPGPEVPLGDGSLTVRVLRHRGTPCGLVAHIVAYDTGGKAAASGEVVEGWATVRMILPAGKYRLVVTGSPCDEGATEISLKSGEGEEVEMRMASSSCSKP